MKISDAFPSKYVRAADLRGRGLRAKIAAVTEETIGGEQKPVMHFEGKLKPMVLNKTNGLTIAARYGGETDSWTGAEIELHPTTVNFQGRPVEFIRVRVPPRNAAGGLATRPTNVMPNARAEQAPPDDAPPDDERFTDIEPDDDDIGV